MVELECIRGIPFIYTVKLSSKSCEYIDLNNSTIIMKVRPSMASEEVLVECNLDNGRIKLTNPFYGEFLINIEGTVTEKFTNICVFDILVITISGDYYLIAKDGKIRSRDFASR